ncbi:MAG: hypothetical protein WBV55_11820 [Candidatus Sulfotelmatobacter sp.]
MTLFRAAPAWDLQQALAIKVVGQIVGTGTAHGQQSAFLLTSWRAE